MPVLRCILILSFAPKVLYPLPQSIPTSVISQLENISEDGIENTTSLVVSLRLSPQTANTYSY